MNLRSIRQACGTFALLSSAAVAVTACGAGSDYGTESGTSIAQEALCSGKLVVRQPDEAEFSSGVATAAPASSAQPDVCGSVKCVAFELDIDLPRQVWKKPGGVQVAIRWPDDTNILNLFVYQGTGLQQGDVQVGSQLGVLAASAGSVLLRSAQNGRYTIYVALDPAGSVDPQVHFDVTSRVQYDPAVRPIRPLRPDLSIRPQGHVGFDTPSFPFFGDPDPAPGETCYDSEKAEDGAHVCLRFDQSFANVGEGAAELRFAIPHDPADTSHDVTQRTYFSDSAAHFQDTPAGEFEFHAAHGHYHYENFAKSSLWATDSKGKRAGSAPVTTGRKVSFCFEDESIDDGLWGERGVSARTYRAPDCLVVQTSDANFDYLIQGLSPGWVDLYQWYLPGQYLEVSGVPDGLYILETQIDPDNEIIETDERNNCGSMRVRLSHMGTPQHKAELLGQGPACK
ncbi:MAG TPA: lysyl oxidase family protein [Polyangiaceae bacterium]